MYLGECWECSTLKVFPMFVDLNSCLTAILLPWVYLSCRQDLGALQIQTESWGQTFSLLQIFGIPRGKVVPWHKSIPGEMSLSRPLGNLSWVLATASWYLATQTEISLCLTTHRSTYSLSLVSKKTIISVKCSSGQREEKYTEHPEKVTLN